MKITDKLAFRDAQIMARIAFCKLDSSFWFAAMQALKAAYKQPINKGEILRLKGASDFLDEDFR